MSLTEDFFSMDFSDLGQLIKELDMFDEKQNTAVLNAIHKAGDMIEAEQKRLAPDFLKEYIKKGRVYLTKQKNNNSVGITVGYQSDVFKTDENGFNPGIIGTMHEFGRPGQSDDARRKSETMKQTRKIKGVKKEVIINKGKIDPVPHIRRGFDNVKEQAVQMVIDSVMSELEKIFNE